MFLILRKSLVTFLLVLQFFAPLVHAHVGEIKPAYLYQNSTAIHLPGFETLDLDKRQSEFQAFAQISNFDGIVVGIDVGIKNVVSFYDADLGESYFLPQQNFIFSATYSPFDSNFSPQAEQFICCVLLHVLSPRAPPAL